MLALAAFLLVSCKETKVDCGIDTELVSKFIQENKFSVIDGKFYRYFSRENGSINADSFITYQLQEKIFFDSIYNSVQDTLGLALGLENFEQLVKDRDDKGEQFIRLIKTTFGFGANDLLIIDVHKSYTNITFRRYEVKRDKMCNVPPLRFRGRKGFTKECFQLIRNWESNLLTDEWQELTALIQDTGFTNTAYFNRGTMICDGWHYSISYSDGYQYDDNIYQLERSCPSEKTAIHLVADKLIHMTKGS